MCEMRSWYDLDSGITIMQNCWYILHSLRSFIITYFGHSLWCSVCSCWIQWYFSKFIWPSLKVCESIRASLVRNICFARARYYVVLYLLCSIPSHFFSSIFYDHYWKFVYKLSKLYDKKKSILPIALSCLRCYKKSYFH